MAHARSSAFDRTALDEIVLVERSGTYDEQSRHRRTSTDDFRQRLAVDLNITVGTNAWDLVV